MISSRRLALWSVCAVATVLSLSAARAQQPGNTFGNGFRAPSSVPPGPTPATPALTTEMRGDIYMARKMYREAIDMYREGSPDSAVLANKIGIAFHQLMMLDLAKKNYARAVKLNPKYSEAINNLGTVCYAEKNYRRAISLYKNALKHTENPSASIYANVGAAYFARKDYKRASEWYNEALKLDPDVFEHHSSYGTLMQERTSTELAVFHLYLAKTYAKSGKNDRAILYLRRAMEEGVKDREKIPDMPEFASLKADPAFVQLMTDNPKPL